MVNKGGFFYRGIFCFQLKSRQHKDIHHAHMFQEGIINNVLNELVFGQRSCLEIKAKRVLEFSICRFHTVQYLFSPREKENCLINCQSLVATFSDVHVQSAYQLLRL